MDPKSRVQFFQLCGCATLRSNLSVTEVVKPYDLFAQPNSYMDSPSTYDKTLSILSKPSWVNSEGVVSLDIFRFLWKENGKDTNRFAMATA